MSFTRWLRRNRNRNRCQVGLYLGGDKLRVAVQEAKSLRFATYSTPDLPHLAKGIAQILGELSLIGDLQVNLGRCHYQHIQAEKPKVPEAEVGAALPWLLRDQLSAPPSELVLDYYDLPQLSGHQPKVAVVSCARMLVEQLAKGVGQAGCRLIGISTDELALCELLEASEQVQVLLYQPKGHEPLILVVYRQQLYLARLLRGFAELVERPLAECPPHLFENFTLELQRSFDYLVSQLKLPEVARIHIAMGADDLTVLVKGLHRVMDLPVMALANKAMTEGIDYLPAFAALMQLEEAK